MALAPVEAWPAHTKAEPCPVCGQQLKQDPEGGHYLQCPRCGWKGW